jgi:molecular chaperone GrpE
MAEEQKHPSAENQPNQEEEQTVEAIFAEEQETGDAQKNQKETAEAGEDQKPADDQLLKAELEKANETIKELQSKLEESENRYLRLRADFDNYRRRVNLDREAGEKYRAQALIADLLPAIDNFERALSMAEKNEHTKQLLQGMEMVYRNILDALKKEGVEPIETEGKEFDPHFHQAIMQAQEEGVPSNMIVEEFQKGYKLKDRVIRPSMVKVNQ